MKTREALDARVKDGTLFAWIALRPSALVRTQGREAERVPHGQPRGHEGPSRTSQRRVRGGEGAPGRTREREPRRGRDPDEPGPLEALNVIATGKAGSITATVMPFVFTLLLFLTIVTVSQALITSTLEEKGNRVIEVLLSSVSPFQLMAGKIVGTCAVGSDADDDLVDGRLRGARDQGAPAGRRRATRPVHRVLPARVPADREPHGRGRERMQHAEGGPEPPLAHDVPAHAPDVLLDGRRTRAQRGPSRR